MSVLEVLVGDFEPGVARIQHSATGVPSMTITNLRGRVEEISIQTDIEGAAEASHGRIADYVARWMLDNPAAFAENRKRTFRNERLFVVVLTDGRKFVARSSADVVAEFKAFAAAMHARRRQEARPRHRIRNTIRGVSLDA